MNTKELCDKIGNSSFNAVIKHPYYKEHIASSYHDPVFHHETTSSGSHSTIKADIPFGDKKKTITFQYHKNKVYNAHYALDGKHIKSHKDVNESRYQDKPEHRLLGTTSLANIYKKDTPGQKMSIAKKIIKSIQEAKIGDKVQVTHGSQKGLVGHVGEIRKGVAKGDHTYTVDYEEGGKRQSVQVKKAHTKMFKESSDELNKKTPSEDDIMKKHNMNKTELDHHLAIGIKVEMEHTKNAAVAREIALDHINEKPDYYAKLKKMVEETELEEASIYSSSMAGRGRGGMRAKAPNASDMASFGTYHVTVHHSEGDKTYKLKNMKDSRHAQNVALKIHRKDNPEHKISSASADKVEVKEETINEISKQVMGRYVQKAATSMATAAFGQGQASASRRPPSEKDLKTGSKRMTGIVRATHKMAKEETEQVDELNQMTLSRYAATARVKAMDKNDPKNKQRVIGTSRAYSKLTRGDFSEEQVNELKKSTMQSYLDKTVDPVHGMPKSADKLPQRMKGIERASKKVISKVNEQQFLTIPDSKEKEHKVAAQQKMARARYISKKNSEEHKVHMGVHEETEYKPHSVSVQLKHPHYEGVTRKIVKVNAKSTKHAEDIVATHYGRRGFKVHKVDYAKLHKEQFPKNAQEKQVESDKKEDNKIKKIASAIKDATK